MLAKPDGIKADDKSQERNDKKTSKPENQVPFQEKTNAEKAHPHLERNENND